MTELGTVGVTASDESLVLLARAGNKSAFAELWQRHAHSGVRVARQFTSSGDADDLVSEAYVRIYQRVLAGGGPDGAFRPYLYTTIRNLAARWGQSDRSVNVDDIGEFEAVIERDDPATVALDRTLTARAFRSLPDRWQTVLWYTEVEGMDPHEVAPLLGISANGVAALSYRAREGLRKAWLQAHVSDATSTGDCRWTIERLGDHARNGLTSRERDRVHEHLGTCAKCSIISEEVDEVGSRLALVMIPLILGGAVGGMFLASLSAPSGAMASELISSTMPPAFQTLAVAAPAVGLTAVSVSAPLVGALALAIVVSGGLAATSIAAEPPAAVSNTAALSGAEDAPLPSSVSPTTVPWLMNTVSRPLDPGSTVGVLLPGLGRVVSSVGSVGTVVDSALGGVVGPVDALVGINVGDGRVPAGTAASGILAASALLTLTGTGTRGATVVVQAAGVDYGAAIVGLDGHWALRDIALPNGVGTIRLSQTPYGFSLSSAPLKVLSNSLGVVINVTGF